MLDFKCPGCSASHQLPDRVFGRKFRCPSCKAKVKHHPDGRIEIKEAAPAIGMPSPAGLEVEEDIPEISLPALNRDISGAASTPPRFTPESLAGTVVGNYKLIGLVGSGSAGHVYVAEHLTLKRKMAVKLLAPALAPSPERVARLAQEAVALAKVDHPNVVHVYDFWIEKGAPYIAMQFVDGPSLDQAVKSGGPFPMDRLLKLAQDLLTGLEVIHQAGLLHRDIKPSNVLLTKEGDARLADFGLAWETPQVSALPANVFSGTAEYAAPELAVGQPPDARTDLYALGGTLYRAATGAVPFSGSSVAEKLKKQLYEPLPPPRSLNPQITPAFELFLQTLLSKEREARPPTAKDALKLLGPVGRATSPPRKNTRRILAVRTASASIAPVLIASLAVVGALGAIAYIATQAKNASKKDVAAKKTAVEPATPKDSAPKVDDAETADLERLEFLFANSSPSEAIIACTDFLRKHPKSPHCESVLIKKMELQQQFERRPSPVPEPGRRPAPAPAPAPAPPPAKPEPPRSGTPGVTIKRLKRPTYGVPCRPLPEQVREGLHWLARHQTEGGYWDMELYPQLCTGTEVCSVPGDKGSPDYHIGVNSLAILAFLGAGIGLNANDKVEDTHLGDAVREGVRYLIQVQGADGRIGNSSVPKHIYNQALAVHALAEALRSVSASPGYSAEGAARIRKSLDAATQYLLIAQNPGTGWRYGVRPGDNDSSVTAAALLALHAARRAGIVVPDHAIEGGLDWFRQVTDTNGRVGYNAKGTGKVYIPGKNEQFLDHATLTAAAGVCQMLMGKDSKSSRVAIPLVARDLPQVLANGTDYYYWYYGTRFATLVFEPRDLDTWKSAVLRVLKLTQYTEETTCRRGAWSIKDRWSCEGGRFYATAINTLTLEYATLPRPFEYVSSRPADEVAPLQTGWVFKLKNGGKLQALSFEEHPDSYQVKIAGGSVKVSKEDVEQIQKVDSKGK